MVVNIAGMTSCLSYAAEVVSITGMILNNLTAGGQYHRNYQINLLKKGWSAWPERVVNIIGTGGQDGSDYTAGRGVIVIHKNSKRIFFNGSMIVGK